MAREEQDKNWSLLSEESKYHYKTEYKNRLEDSERNPEGGGDLTVLTSQKIADDLEKIFGKHNLKPVTYEDVASELFEYGYYYYDYVYDEIVENSAACERPMACTSHKQVEKICAINRLLNVAKFLNKNEDGSDWVPDFKNKDEKNNKIWSLGIDEDDDEIRAYIVDLYGTRSEFVYFRTKEIAEQAVQILGKHVVSIALTTKY